MANYAIVNSSITGGGGVQQAVASTYKTLLDMRAATSGPRRIKVYDILIGTNGTPADNALEFDMPRTTGAGTITAATPQALDPADAAATTVGGVNATAEGTITANSDVFYIGINQRASYRWVAAPGSELVAPATSSNGFALRVRSGTGYTGTATGAVLFQEQ